jgi:hypothetical protein
MFRKVQQRLLLSVIIAALCFYLSNNSALALSQYQSTYPPLKDLVVSPDEMKKFTDFATPNDVTDEISELCFYDCVKMTWGTTSDGLTLLMVRFSSAVVAEKSAQNLRAIYQSFGDKYYSFSDPKNSAQWSGQLHPSRNKFQWVASDTQGSVLIFSSYRKVLNNFVADIDGSYYQDMVESMTRVQKQKLKEAGFTQ